MIPQYLKNMDFIKKEIIFKRFEDGAYDLAMAIISKRKDDIDSVVKHLRDAGEAISQTLEYSLKNHLYRRMPATEKLHFRSKGQNIKDLIDKYVDEEGDDNGYQYRTITDDIDPSVDFLFLKNNKKELTNASKHEGKMPNFNIQIKYLKEVKKFINEYIDENVSLKGIEDFDGVDYSNWDLFYTACDRFRKQERTYILIIGPTANFDKSHLKNLAIPKWDLIIDFDYDSEKDGFFSIAFKNNGLPQHIIKASDIVDANSFSRYTDSHYHYFINNFAGSGEPETTDYREWTRKFGTRIEALLKAFANIFLSQKTIIVNLHNSRKQVNFLCEKIDQHFGTSSNFIFANDVNNELEQVCNDFHGIMINISINEIAEGLGSFSTNFGMTSPYKDQYLVPFLENSETKDVTGILSSEVFHQLEEDFEVLHKGLPDKIDPDDDRRRFLCGGNKISYFGLKERFDVERQTFAKKYLKFVERLIENGRGKIFLQHDAGYGGTTLARRIAWELRNDYPVLILKKYRDNKVKEKIIDLHQRTRKTIFVVMEVPQSITLDEVDSLYKSIPLSRPVVFLIVKRGRPSSANKDLVLADWGNDTPDLAKAYIPFLKEYADPSVRQKKENEISKIIFSNDAYMKTPFYIGLLTFEEKFYAIKDYIAKFVLEIQNKEEQRNTLAYLSICEFYLGQGLPGVFFKTVFRLESKHDIFTLEKYFAKDSSIIESLLVSYLEGNQKHWRLKHVFLAKELLKQLLSGNSENPEIWKQGLADICVKFIEDSTANNSGTNEYFETILQKLFIGTQKDRAGEAFTEIINHLTSNDEKERVFLALKNNYPDNPHFCSHLARFYAYYSKNREKALNFADEAIRLSEIAGMQDPLLYHIKGMCLRSVVRDMTDKHRKQKISGDAIVDGEYDEILYVLIPQAAKEFESSREISNRQGRVDKHGYVAHIQLLIMAIDYGIAMSGLSKAKFLNQNKEPFADWLDLAESLLEDIKRTNHNDDDDRRIEDCQNGLDELYENYDLILQNLKSQLEKGKNPTRIRRQIVRTYFRTKEDYTRDSKVINNILSLMEQNIDNEPDNERNFYLWFQAARHSKISIEDALSKLAKWHANSRSIDAIYYFYILKVFRALQGYSEAVIDAFSLIRECRAKGKSNITPYEWYGKGVELNRLVSRNKLTDSNRSQFLQLVKGYFTEYLHDGSGRITIVDKLEVFFSPTQAKLTSNDLNKEVEFFLAFSYDGLRADSFSVRIVGQEPRNAEDKTINE
jgi:hypothetical protein